MKVKAIVGIDFSTEVVVAIANDCFGWTEQADKLRRVLNWAGAARFSNISESLSHVVVGQRVDAHWRQLQLLAHKPHVVTVEWLVQRSLGPPLVRFSRNFVPACYSR